MNFRISKILCFVLLFAFSSIFQAQQIPGPGGFEEPTSPIDMYVILLAFLAVGLVYVVTKKNTKKI